MYTAIFFASVIVASVSQILLKKSAMKQYDSWVKEYLNPYVIIGYGLLFLSMVMTIYAYKGVELKTGPVIESTSYLYVAILSAVFLKEKISNKKKLGLLVIVAGVIVSSL
ncbi:MAG: multidrug ABC transporter [Lachnospiraceae bacterium]|jgi:drug/metabolite transporter (DMT)-like permease|nr:multidrug ABC transporter [Lachnospiraceae bacterium]